MRSPARNSDVLFKKMKTRLRILLSLLIICLGFTLAVFWWQALKEFSLFGQTELPQSHAQVQNSFPTYYRACQITMLEPIPAVELSSYSPGAFMMQVLRHLYPGVMVGQIIVIIGCYLLVATFIPPRFRYTKGMIRLLAIIIIAWINSYGFRICIIGPWGEIVPFGTTRISPVTSSIQP